MTTIGEFFSMDRSYRKDDFMYVYFLFATLVGEANQEGATAQALLETVRGMNAWIEDITFDWETRGAQVVPEKHGTVNAPTRPGRYRYRPTDGAMWVEFYEYQADGRQYKKSLSYFAGTKRTLLEDLRTGTKDATSERSAKRWRFQEGDLPWYIVYLPYFTDLLTQETPVELIGWENESGHRCAHLAIYEYGTRDAGTHLWIDVQRGGHPLRVEHRAIARGIPNVQRAVVKDIVLEQVTSATAEKVWFPVKGTCETISDGHVVYRSAITIAPDTIRFNQGLTDRDFEITVPIGTAVANLNEPVPVPTGSAELVTRQTAVPTLVADTVRRAEQQKLEIEARSRTRRPVSWTTLVSWFLAGTAVVFLGAVLYVRRARS